MSFLFPDRRFQRFEDVTPALLKKEGVHLLICDLDNTLRLRSEKSPDPGLSKWIESCRQAKTKVVVISNNARRKVIRSFCEPLGIDSVSFAKKPLTTKLTAFMAKYNYGPQETVMLGDKWSTDVLAAKFAKIRAWQVAHRKDII